MRKPASAFRLLAFVVCLSALGACSRGPDAELCDLGHFLDSAREILDIRRHGEGKCEVPAWDRRSKYEVVYYDEKKLSYCAEEYRFMGGAHGSTQLSVGTIDRRTGRRYALADVVPPDRRDDVVKQIRENIAKTHYGLMSYEVLKSSTERRLLREPELTENFYIDDRNIHFIYNQYEIAPYADGVIEAIIPLPE